MKEFLPYYAWFYVLGLLLMSLFIRFYFYKKKYKSPQINSEYLFKKCISLPCHENINIDKILSKINYFYEKNISKK